MSSTPYDVHEVIVAARPVAGVHAQVPRGRVGQEFGRHLDQVYAAARAGAVHLDGQNIFIYRAATAEELTVDFCVGVAAMTTHIGDYGQLGEANAEILAWCRAHHRLPAGPSWEVYGHWNPDPAQLRTEVYWLLQATGVEATSLCKGARATTRSGGATRGRRPDPRIAARLTASFGDAQSVLNVGAGAGSYEPPDRRVVAAEPSAVMIAQRPAGAAPAVQARAEALPFPDRAFDAAMAVLTLHHWADRAA